MSRLELWIAAAAWMGGCATATPAAERPDSSEVPIRSTPIDEAGSASTSSAAATVPRTDPRFDLTLSAYQYPYPVQTLELDSQGQALEMAYLDVAPTSPERGVVLLLHGKNFTASYWEATIGALVSRGYRVIAPDQIGWGKSDKPPDYQFSFQALAQNTRALLDHAKVKRAAVVGHSMGGMLATRFALMYPERTSRLVLVNPIGLEDWKTVVPYRSIDEWYESELKQTAEGIREYQRSSYYDGQWKPEYEALIEIAKGQVQSADWTRVAWVSARVYDMIFTQPVVYEFGDLRVPTLLLIGQRDRTAVGRAWTPEPAKSQLGDYPTLGRKTQQAIPNAELVEFPGVGHMPQVEAFDRYMEALTSFLEKSRPRETNGE